MVQNRKREMDIGGAAQLVQDGESLGSTVTTISVNLTDTVSICIRI